MSCLIGDSWVLTSASAFHLLPYVVLVKGFEKIWPHTEVWLGEAAVPVCFSDTKLEHTTRWFLKD